MILCKKHTMNALCGVRCCLVRMSCSTLLRFHGLQPARLLCPWDSSGASTRVGCHFLLQGLFLTQGSNLSLLHCRQILYHLSHQGNKQVAFSIVAV